MFYKNILFCLFFFLISCSGIEFTYKDFKNTENPIYNKTTVYFTGVDFPALSRNSSRYIGGDNKNEYKLFINVEEEKTKRAVQNNQAISKLDYKLIFNYSLLRFSNDCLVYEKSIISRFSYAPKSSGYNFGSDKSLDKKYELAAQNNIIEFVNSIPQKESLACPNES